MLVSMIYVNTKVGVSDACARASRCQRTERTQPVAGGRQGGLAQTSGACLLGGLHAGHAVVGPMPLTRIDSEPPLPTQQQSSATRHGMIQLFCSDLKVFDLPNCWKVLDLPNRLKNPFDPQNSKRCVLTNRQVQSSHVLPELLYTCLAEGANRCAPLKLPVNFAKAGAAAVGGGGGLPRESQSRQLTPGHHIQ